MSQTESEKSLELQSGVEVLESQATSDTMIQQQTTTFIDENEGVAVGDATRTTIIDTSDGVVSADLGEYLARPVRIHTFQWSEADPMTILNDIDPWYNYFNNAAIKYKLNNFSFIRADLHLKFVINASPFYYGALRAAYQPLPNFKQLPNQYTGVDNQHFINYSQLPGVWLSPQHSEGSTMTLNFFYPKNWIRTQVAQDFRDMGKLRFLSYTTLQSANGVTGQGVTVQVYAWAENVELAGPSVGLALQGDEYGVGPVSGPASTVARLAGLVKGVPIIGKFATATEMGANAISGIAKLFGFTNVPVIEPAQPVRPNPFPPMASSEIGYPVEKLTIDSKNELTIDPSAIGLPSTDELSIEYLCKKQSWLVNATWATTSVVDQPLFTARVTPALCDFDLSQTYSPTFMTPMCWVSQLFREWRGDIIFTFKIVASPFHKGRLRISYDPYNSSMQTSTDIGPQNFSVIVDLGAQDEVEIRIPYQQALPWLKVDNDLFGEKNWTTSGSPSFALNDLYYNGIVSVKVLTQLTAPVATAPVQIMCFAKAAENIEFANPTELPDPISNLSIQSGREEILPLSAPMGETHEIEVDRTRINFGENIRSVRQLLRRSAINETFVSVTSGGQQNQFGYWRMTRFPVPFGYANSGLTQVVGLQNPTGTYNFNATRNTAYNWIAPAFVGQRGSMHLTFNAEANAPVRQFAFSRYNKGAGQVSRGINVNAGVSESQSSMFYLQTYPRSMAGTALTNQETCAGLSVSMPHMSPYKFQSTNPVNITNPPNDGTNQGDGSRDDQGILTWSMGNATGTPQTSQMKIHKYVGCGTDFSLYYFLCTPTFINYITYPSGV